MYYVVVGGSKFQSGLIDAALNANYKVICIDANVNCYCFLNYKLQSYNISTTNIHDAINSLSNFPIIGASTCQSDVGVPLVGAINDHFLLCGPSLEISSIISNKYLFRKFCFDHGLTKYKSTLCKLESDIDNQIFEFPVIVKPIDSSGSRGVKKIYDAKDLLSSITSAINHSRTGYAVIEKFFEGEEIGCQACVDHQGVVSYLFHTDLSYNSIPYGHSLISSPSKLAVKKIMEFIEISRIKSAWFNFDLIITNSTIEIIEVGLRLGATELDKLFNYCTGKSAYETIVRNDYNFIVDSSRNDYIYGVLFNPLECAYVIKYPNEFIEFLLSYSIEAELDYDLSIVEPFINGTKRFGRFKCPVSTLNIGSIFSNAIQKFGEKYV